MKKQKLILTVEMMVNDKNERQKPQYELQVVSEGDKVEVLLLGDSLQLALQAVLNRIY